MNTHIQQEIDRTLDCLGDGLDIQVNPLFVQGLTNRMARLQIKQVSGYQRRASYPAVIAILLVLNLGAGLLSFKTGAWLSTAEVSDNPVSVLALEYGLEQRPQLSF